MNGNSISVEAVFENGVLRPVRPLPLRANQRITITFQLPETRVTWPDDVAAIYQEIAAEDRRLAEAMASVQETPRGSLLD
jgi:predicted DNA-binding antitoxin AbrB/MazE fold protein